MSWCKGWFLWPLLLLHTHIYIVCIEVKQSNLKLIAPVFSIEKLMNMSGFTFTPPYIPMLWYLIKHRDNIKLIYYVTLVNNNEL
jgi:hypothetical protein